MTRLLLFPLSSPERQQSGKEYKGKGTSSYTGCRSKKKRWPCRKRMDDDEKRALDRRKSPVYNKTGNYQKEVFFGKGME